MTFGTPDEVIEATKEALRKGMPAVFYPLSSNSIHSAVKPETIWLCYKRCTNMANIHRTA